MIVLMSILGATVMSIMGAVGSVVLMVAVVFWLLVIGGLAL